MQCCRQFVSGGSDPSKVDYLSKKVAITIEEVIAALILGNSSETEDKQKFLTQYPDLKRKLVSLEKQLWEQYV